jgi:hypothetical protein
MKKCLILTGAIVMTLAHSGAATAALLAPGASIANDGLPAAAAGGMLLADTTVLPYMSVGVPVIAGTYREIVLKGDLNNPFGLDKLDFVYQVTAAVGSVGSFTMTDYTGSMTNASAVTSAVQNANNPPATVPWLATTAFGGLFGATPIHRTGDGSTVSFAFNDALFGPGNTSVVMIVRTNATAFVPGAINVIDGNVAHEPGFAPAAPLVTPEPASLLLFGGLSLGVGAMAFRRHRKGGPVIT